MATPTDDRLRISDLAARTGFSGPTLRYYEEIGLLPAPERTAAGYRTYGRRDVARLRFVARAKRLGCTLDEIRDLVGAWEEDRCEPVQHRLRSLVEDKALDARDRIAELEAFTADLQVAADRLADEPVDGPCDDDCGCAVPEDPLPRVAVELRPHPDAGPPVACSLGSSAAATRLEEWRRATTHTLRREAIDGGVRLVLGADAPVDDVLRLARAEHSCCPFFAFALTVDDRGVALEVTAPPEAADAITAVFGMAEPC